MVPPMMDREPIDEVPQEGPSDLKTAKQVFEKEMKKMRIKSRNTVRGDRKMESASRDA